MAAPKPMKMIPEKKIMFLVQDRPNWTGGPIINIRRLLPALKAAGYEILAPTGYRKDAPNARFLEEQGITCPLFELPAPTEDYVAWILEQVDAFKPDVFVGDTHIAGGYALRWLNEWGIPSIMMARSVDEYNLEIARSFFVEPSIYQANALVCVNASIAAKVAHVTNEHSDLIKVIPSGGPLSTHIAQYKTSPFRLAFAGVLRDEPKRLLKLWEAFVFAREEMPDLELTFIGDGPLRPILETLVLESGLERQVTFTGVLFDEFYKAKLAEHQALLLFSDFEGTPGSVMDAMSCGVVPLCRDIEGIDTLIRHGENGLIFDGSKEHFVLQLKKLREEYSWKRYSVNAVRDFENQFSLEITLARWQDLLQVLLNTPIPKSPIKVPKHVSLPPVRYHFANADRRKHPLYALLRGVYIIWKRMIGKK
jgi:glycosyltransferase involved in cell wall biosynthesis